MREVSRSLLLASALAVAVAGCSNADDQATNDDNNNFTSAGGSGAAEGTPEERAAFEAFATKRGLPPKSDRALVIGIRGRSVDGSVHPTRVVREFDDTVLILTPDKRILRLAISTHPWETKGVSGVPDVNHDGASDVGMIRPGIYTATRRDPSRDIAGARTYAVTNIAGQNAIPGFRNTDHDDHYSDEEVAASTKRSDILTDILFHQGGPPAPAAVGCQVLEAAGIRRLATEAGARFDYLLVDVNSDRNPEEIPSS